MSSDSSTSSPAAASTEAKTLQSAAVFKAIQRRINADTVKKVKASFRFDISPDKGGTAQSWIIDLKEGDGVVRSAGAADKGDCTLALSDSDFVQLMTGRLNPQTAFMKGKLKVKGNLLLAQKLTALMPQKKKPKPAAPAEEGEEAEHKQPQEGSHAKDKIKSNL